MVADMPFKTYSTKSLVLKNSKKILKRLLHGKIRRKKVIEQIKFLIKNKIPVMGLVYFNKQKNLNLRENK